MQEEKIKLTFLAWLEIPYFVGINYDEIHAVNYQTDLKVLLRFKFRNDLLRIMTSNRWLRAEFYDKQINGITDSLVKEIRIPSYITEAELPVVKCLVEKKKLPYLHIEKLETVVELSTELEVSKKVYEAVKEGIFNYLDIHPRLNFFNTEVLPILANVVNTYRVATLPSIRYTIHPVSEALVQSAFIEFQDRSGEILLQSIHGFDIRNHNRTMQRHVENLGIQTRFDELIQNHEDIEYELQFCSSYYLFHMRRWAEAVTIASGVVDSLVRETVFSKLEKSVADLIWKKYRTQTKDVFNEILPALGFSKLADENKKLWDSFTKAKDYRGSAAHGKSIQLFDKSEEAIVQNHLKTIYCVARWVSIQIERPWKLDVEADGENLPFF